MLDMPTTDFADLSHAEVRDFIEQGYFKLDQAFASELASRGREELWAAMGLSPDRPEGWTQPVIRLGFLATPTFVEAANTARLHRAYDALVGEGRWQPPQGLGTFPIRFPSASGPGDAGWHVDMGYATENPDFMQWRINVASRGRALLMLFLFSDVGEDDAPTVLLRGSHAALARRLLPHGEQGMTLGELVADGFASTERCERVLATGAAGTVYLCHPFLVHSAQPHRGTQPRFMAQPSLLPKGEGDPGEGDPGSPLSPVQIAIRKACGQAL